MASIAPAFAPAVAAAQEAGGGGTAAPATGAGYAMEVFFILVFFGAALFAVCKGSRRQ